MAGELVRIAYFISSKVECAGECGLGVSERRLQFRNDPA